MALAEKPRGNKRTSLEGPNSDSKDGRNKKRNPLRDLTNQPPQSRSAEKKPPLSKPKPSEGDPKEYTFVPKHPATSPLPILLSEMPAVTQTLTSAMEIDDFSSAAALSTSSTTSSASSSTSSTTSTVSSRATSLSFSATSLSTALSTSSTLLSSSSASISSSTLSPSSTSMFSDSVAMSLSSELSLVGEDKDKEKSKESDETDEEKPPYTRSSEDEEGHPHSAGILSWHDPLNQYTETIYDELKANELKYRCRADYMEQVQKDINHTMRGILVDWLVEVGEEYKLGSQTLFLTVRYLDRLLSVVSVHRTKLQLVGITCMLLAAKYEEIYPPSVDDFVYISDNTYTRDEVLRMETVLLNSLKFALTNATIWEFARRFSAACGLDKRTTAFVNYLSESFLQEAQYLKFLPSQVGAAAVYLALYTTKQKPWPNKLQRACGYKLDELKDSINALHQTMLRLHQGQCTLKAVKNKYSEPKLHRVALIVPPTELSFS